MKTNKEADLWNYDYFIHVNGLHYERYVTLEAALSDLNYLANHTDTESVALETRDFWLKRNHV